MLVMGDSYSTVASLRNGINLGTHIDLALVRVPLTTLRLLTSLTGTVIRTQQLVYDVQTSRPCLPALFIIQENT
jgi:hypothetical protein